MMNLFERRKRSGMSQFLCAQRSGISRMRLSLAETGQIALSSEEETALSQALTKYILEKAQESFLGFVSPFRVRVDVKAFRLGCAIVGFVETLSLFFSECLRHLLMLFHVL